MNDKPWTGVIFIGCLILILLAMLLNKPMKVSILENVFIEVGGDGTGPPQFYPTAVELPDGQIVYFPCEPK